MAYACIAAAILYLIPGFVLLARRPGRKKPERRGGLHDVALVGQLGTTVLWIDRSMIQVVDYIVRETRAVSRFGELSPSCSV